MGRRSNQRAFEIPIAEAHHGGSGADDRQQRKCVLSSVCEWQIVSEESVIKHPVGGSDEAWVAAHVTRGRRWLCDVPRSTRRNSLPPGDSSCLRSSTESCSSCFTGVEGRRST